MSLGLIAAGSLLGTSLGGFVVKGISKFIGQSPTLKPQKKK